MGSTRPLDAFTFIFQETEWGPFIAHAYQYEAGRSTWIFETDPETFERAGLEGLSEQQSADRMAEIFGWFLEGHPLLINRSMWRNFPMIRSKRSVKDNMVLIGDAKATAHFSIGSGTKLAMEDAIALEEALGVPDGCRCAEQYETVAARRSREPSMPPISLVWFEHLDRFWELDPLQFTFGLMTRSKAITYDNLLSGPRTSSPRPTWRSRGSWRARLRRRRREAGPADVPALSVARDGDRESRRGVADVHVFGKGRRARRFPPRALRLARDGRSRADLHRDDLRLPDARITPGCAGLWNDEQEAAWRRIVDFVHANSAAKIALQLGHAGRKGATRLMWDGMDRPLEQGGWDVVSASPLPYFPDSRMPRELDRAAMDAVKADFVQAAERGEAAASICWNCTPPTAICWPVSSRR